VQHRLIDSAVAAPADASGPGRGDRTRRAGRPVHTCRGRTHDGRAVTGNSSTSREATGWARCASAFDGGRRAGSPPSHWCSSAWRWWWLGSPPGRADRGPRAHACRISRRCASRAHRASASGWCSTPSCSG